MMKLFALAAVLAASTTACGVDTGAPSELTTEDIAAAQADELDHTGALLDGDAPAVAARQAGAPAGARDSAATGSDVACPPAVPPTEQEMTGVAHTDALDGAPAVAKAKSGIAKAAPVDGTQTADFCDHLPADGACSLACDPEKLVEQYVPAGTCVLITCQLDTGETFKTGGCHPAD